jgi:amino acid transporter
MMRIPSSLKWSTTPGGVETASLFYLVFSGMTLDHILKTNNSVSWVMTDYDATAHITEEMKNPAVKAPVGILSALAATYILGLGLNIALSVCMGPSWPDLLSTPTGLPMAQLLYNVLGKTGGVAFMALAAIICNFTGTSCLQAQARTLFAVSRGCFPPIHQVNA